MQGAAAEAAGAGVMTFGPGQWLVVCLFVGVLLMLAVMLWPRR